MLIKKIALYFLLPCFVILIIALSCTQNAARESKQTIRLNLGTEPPTLDSRRAIDSTSNIVLKMLFDGLTRLTPNGKAKPSIAETIYISEDLKTYTFRLRKALWSNGDPLTAADFAYAWKWILNPKNPADYAYQLYVIKNAKAAKLGQLPLDEIGIHVLDDQTLVVELENPTPYFLELTCLSVYYPVNKKMDERAEGTEITSENYISNGPFKLSSRQYGSEIIVEKNENYWDLSSVKLDKIELLMISDANTELSLFEQGELDWAGTPLSLGLPADAIPELKKSGQLHIKPEAATYFYVLNTERPPLTNVNLRKALAYAINRKVIVENITQANQLPATSLLPPPLALQSSPYFQDGDVPAAQKLFQEALVELKLKKEDFPTLTISYNTSENHGRIAQAIQQQLKNALGIHVELQNFEWKVFLDNVRQHNFEIARTSWVADFNDPITFLEMFKYKNNSTNSSNWENPEYVELLNRASKEGNYKKRLEILHQAETLLMSEMPIIPIYFLMNSYLKNPKLQNVYLSGLGDIDFKWAYME